MSPVTVQTMIMSTSSGFTPANCKRLARGGRREVGRGLMVGGDAALLDAGAADDPLIVGLDDFFEVGVGENALRRVGPCSKHNGIRQGDSLSSEHFPPKWMPVRRRKCVNSIAMAAGRLGQFRRRGDIH